MVPGGQAPHSALSTASLQRTPGQQGPAGPHGWLAEQVRPSPAVPGGQRPHTNPALAPILTLTHWTPGQQGWAAQGSAGPQWTSLAEQVEIVVVHWPPSHSESTTPAFRSWAGSGLAVGEGTVGGEVGGAVDVLARVVT